jgi:hypothetical protein
MIPAYKNIPTARPNPFPVRRRYVGGGLPQKMKLGSPLYRRHVHQAVVIAPDHLPIDQSDRPRRCFTASTING